MLMLGWFAVGAAFLVSTACYGWMAIRAHRDDLPPAMYLIPCLGVLSIVAIGYVASRHLDTARTYWRPAPTMTVGVE